MKKSFDLRNLECPKPVLETKKIIEKNPYSNIEIILNSEVSKENVLRFLSSFKIIPEVVIKEDSIYITFNTQESANIALKEEEIICPTSKMAKNIIISTNRMGSGDEKLGDILIKSFIYTLTEREIRPKNLFFLKSGVFLTTEGSPVLEELKKIYESGTEIYSCGTCLDFYNLKSKLAIGKIGNMSLLIDLLYNDGIFI